MSFLDLYTGDQKASAGPQPGERGDLPATFGQTFDAAWSEGRMFGQSVARINARQGVLQDYLDEVRQKTGADLRQDADINSGDWDKANAAVAKLKESAPDLELNPLSDDEIERRAVAKSQQSRAAYAQMSDREKTAGGKFGSFLGSAAAATTDPINLAGVLVAPAESVSILASAARWAGIMGATQAGVEAVGAPYHEEVQPGYTESGEPLANIAEAAAGGAVLGSVTRALANTWMRYKTGTWPTTIRDAGNIVESEAQIQKTNIYPGAAGEAAHREALATATDQILKGDPVHVTDTITPDIQRSSDERVRPLLDARADAQRALAAADAERAGNQGPAPELPFDQTAKMAEAERATSALADRVTTLAKQAGYNMPKEEAAQVAAGMVRSPDADVNRTLGALLDHPSMASEPPVKMPKESPTERPIQAPEEMRKALDQPDHQEALRADIDRARAMKDVKVPVDIDADGNVVHRSVDGAMREVDAYKEMADHITACANPVPEEPKE